MDTSAGDPSQGARLKRSSTNPPSPGRIPAATVRAVRQFHGFDVPTMAETFKVTERSVFRWEKLGVHPDSLPRDPAAHPSSGPDWRSKLLKFMLGRLEAVRVTDNTKKGDQTCITSTTSAPASPSRASS